MTNEIELKDTDRGGFLRRTIIASWVVFIAAALYQTIVFPEIVNLIAILTSAVAWAITSGIWLRLKILQKYLLSSFMILGFTASQLYFPVIFTTLENKPVIFNLELPEQVFLHSFTCLLSLVAAHTIYRYSRRLSLKRSTSLFERAGFFTVPTHLQIWVIGFIGMTAWVYIYFNNPDAGREITGAAGDKLVAALAPFIYAPFLIPLGKLFGSNEKVSKAYLPLIIAYTIGLFIISIARNSRGAFIFGLTTPVLAYALGLLLGVFKTKIFTLRNVVVVSAGVWVLLGPFTDLGTAMLIVRGSRTEISPQELISSTFDVLGDKRAIEQRTKDDNEASMDWDFDERYLDNIFLARFSNIKSNDINLINSSKVGEMDPTMQEYSLDAFISMLPDPVIKLFGFDVDKDATLAVSFGDFMYLLSGGQGYPFGYRIGHIAGTGMATFGWWYVALFGLLAIPVFYVNDKLLSSRSLEKNNPTDSNVKVSFCGLLFLTPFWQFFMMESVVQEGGYLLRTWPQMIALYFIIFQLSRVVNKFPFSKKEYRYKFN